MLPFDLSRTSTAWLFDELSSHQQRIQLLRGVDGRPADLAAIRELEDEVDVLKAVLQERNGESNTPGSERSSPERREEESGASSPEITTAASQHESQGEQKEASSPREASAGSQLELDEREHEPSDRAANPQPSQRYPWSDLDESGSRVDADDSLTQSESGDGDGEDRDSSAIPDEQHGTSSEGEETSSEAEGDMWPSHPPEWHQPGQPFFDRPTGLGQFSVRQSYANDGANSEAGGVSNSLPFDAPHLPLDLISPGANEDLPPFPSHTPGQTALQPFAQLSAVASGSHSASQTPLNSSPRNSNPANNLKRGPMSPEAYREGSRIKQIRISPGPIQTRPETPLSDVSSRSSHLVDIPEEVRQHLSREEIRQQYREMRRLQQQRQERRERECADEAFARALQEEFDRTPAGPGISSELPQVPGMEALALAPVRQNQTYINRSGSLQRPEPTSWISPAATQTDMGNNAAENQATEYNHTAPHHAESSVARWPGSTPSIATNHPLQPVSDPDGRPVEVQEYGMSAPVYVLDSSESEGDLSILPHPTYHGGESQGASTSHRPYGASPITQRSRPFSTYPAPYHPQGAGGTAVYENDVSPDSTWSSRLQAALSSARDGLEYLFGDPWASYGSQPGPVDQHDRSLFTSHRSSLAYSSRWYPDDYHQKSSAETAKEIKELMENIRPDEDLGASDRTGSPDDMAEGCALYEHQKLGLRWMTQMEEGTNKGGILADDMGLGKTIQAIALMVSRRSEDLARKTTLIVAPVALLQQWEQEIKYKIRPGKRLSTYIYHGTKRNVKWDTLKTYDVVLTSYGTLGAEYSRKEKHDMILRHNPTSRDPVPDLTLLDSQTRFFRIILDEAQNIKNKTTKSFKAAVEIQALTRFCMTGTPMMNNVGELYSLIKFLRIKPYDDWRKFSQEIMLPLRESSMSANETAMQRLQALLKAILLRRTKKSEIDGKPILSLPERTTNVEYAVMEGDQLEFYRALESKTQIRFNRYLRAGTVGRNYHGVLLLLLRLRQTCCHPHLIRNLAEEVAGTAEKTPEQLEQIAREHLKLDAVKRLLEEGQVDCPICMDAVENSTIFTPCGHSTCSECFARISDSSQTIDDGTDNRGGKFKCMSCRGAVDATKVTDWVSFKKVYMEPAVDEDQADAADDEVGSSDEDSESSDDEGEEDETDSLDGFIVNDEEDADGKGTGSSSAGDKANPQSKVKFEDEEEIKDDSKIFDAESEHKDAESGSGTKKGKGKAVRRAKGKGKGKAKGKGKEKGKAKREKLNIKLKNPTLSELQKESKRNLKARKLYFDKLREDFVSSAKIDKCLEILDRIDAQSQSEKTIVFSQFTTFLDLLEIPLAERSWAHCRYDGSMSVKQRADAVLEFTRRPRCRVMLASLKAGNSGLNLTAANNVIMLDPFWNPYIEQQAIDRVHRIGQRLPVTCYRILIEGTVEDRIMDIQERKRRIVDGALDEKAASGIARLDVRDLAHLFVSTRSV